MPHLDTAQEWLTQSSLLLKAHPTTTRITTKYTLLHPRGSPHAPSTTHSTASKPRLPKPASPSNPPTTESSTEKTPIPDPPRATLTITTFHPGSGVNLKYSTNKAAEVGRLIQIMGKLGRLMAGLPEEKEGEGMGEIVMGDVEEEKKGAEEKIEEKKVQAQGTGGQGKGKKKKGKK